MEFEADKDINKEGLVDKIIAEEQAFWSDNKSNPYNKFLF